jgi:hypothetical protein
LFKIPLSSPQFHDFAENSWLIGTCINAAHGSNDGEFGWSATLSHINPAVRR